VILVVGVLALRNMNLDGEGDAGGGTAATTTSTTTTTTTTTAPVPTDVRRTLNRLGALTVVPEEGGGSYERTAFGDGWQVDRDGCDTRDDVLAAESRVPATRGRDGCTVTRGEWLSVYDGYSTPDPGELQIDHMVPLAEAWESGASTWTAAERERYANDTDSHRPDALIAVTAATNQSKSDRDPAEWMPPNRDSWCRYATAWITQKRAWDLTIDPAERRALRNVLSSC
jgi:uncharacterized protein DUF1524